MKRAVLSIALAFVAPFAWAQVSETTTTTTTTEGQRDDHGVHSGQSDHPEGKQRTTHLSLRQVCHICDEKRQGVGSRCGENQGLESGVPVRCPLCRDRRQHDG